MDVDNKIFVAGHRGMAGSAVVRALQHYGYNNIITAGRDKLDLTNQRDTFNFFKQQRPQVLFICAATVGGIVANRDYPADFIGSNLMIQTNLLEAARRYDVSDVLFLASGCIYPRNVAQPMREETLLTGALEPTNQWYAVAKIAGIKMGQAYRRQFGMNIISVLPANLYGPGDNFDLETAHVIPALLRKFHEAKTSSKKQVVVWGSGKARRELMHVDDMADACVFLMHRCSPQHEQPPEVINIGGGEEVTIAELVQKIKSVTSYAGDIIYDEKRPDGTPRKLLYNAILTQMGWKPQISLDAGLHSTYAWMLENTDKWRAILPDKWRQAG